METWNGAITGSRLEASLVYSRVHEEVTVSRDEWPKEVVWEKVREVVGEGEFCWVCGKNMEGFTLWSVQRWVSRQKLIFSTQVCARS